MKAITTEDRLNEAGRMIQHIVERAENNIKEYMEASADAINKIAANLIGRRDCIKWKLEHGFALSETDNEYITDNLRYMGQTADINGLVGKRISYHDGFTGSLTEFTITAIRFDQERNGYEVRGTRPQYFFFSVNRMLLLAARKELTYCSKIDGCAFEETFTIQG